MNISKMYAQYLNQKVILKVYMSPIVCTTFQLLSHFTSDANLNNFTINANYFINLNLCYYRTITRGCRKNCGTATAGLLRSRNP